MRIVEAGQPFNHALVIEMLFGNKCPVEIRDQIVASALVRLLSRDNSIGTATRLSAWISGVSVSTIYRRVAALDENRLALSLLQKDLTRAASSRSHVDHHINNVVAS